MKDVAIVGFGPSAMYAILACNDKGIKPDVFYLPSFSQLGAFWLKWLPDSVAKFFSTVPILIYSIGDRKSYIEKQWERVPKEYNSSFPREMKIEQGYNTSYVMNSILKDERRFSKHELLRKLGDDELFHLSSEYRMLFHCFPSNKSLYQNRNSIVNVPCIYKEVSINTNLLDHVQYNGDDSYIVRESTLFGKIFWELTSKCSPRNVDIIGERLKGEIAYFQDMRPGHYLSPEWINSNVAPIGRLATWNRRALAHESYYKVIKFIQEIVDDRS